MARRHLVPVAVLATLAALGLVRPAAAADAPWFDDAASAAISVTSAGFVDGHGRAVVLRGYNVSGEAKLAENGGLPFASTADADHTAATMRAQTGANVIRFLLTWAGTEPVRGQLDTGYLGRVVDQVRAFTSHGFQVFLDFHEDLYSRYLFNAGSWYTGDGAPRWVIDAGNYPKENCGICVQWGQNITQNAAVQDATADFWHNRYGVQDEFLNQAQGTLSYLRQHLSDAEFAHVVGFDPLNEPYAGRYDSGQTSVTWERDVLWPFYLRFRAAMDRAGWAAKPALVEPNLFWNGNLFFARQDGGLANVGAPGTRFVFNTHFYDQAQLSGVFLLGNAGDGRYAGDFRTIRQHAAALGTTGLVSEFGSPITGTGADKTPSVLKAMYQALDSTRSGADWWSHAAASGPVLSGTEWQWDVYSGAHHEAMNDNPAKVQTTGDAWNGEDFSLIAGSGALRVDSRVLDRMYPDAVAGTPLAFTYEDRSAGVTWNPVPASLPNLRTVVGTGQYAVLAWRGGADGAPTELHLPASFPTAGTTVVSDLGTLTGLPAYSAHGHVADTPVAVATVSGDRRLVLSGAAGLHYALVTNGVPAGSAAVRAAAQAELARWAAATFA